MAETEKIESLPAELTPEEEHDLEVFRHFLQIIRNPSPDLRKQLEILLKPKEIKSTSIVDTFEEEFSLSFIYWMAKKWPKVFKGWEEWADIYMLIKISEKGIGREQAIRQIAALQESRLVKSLLLGPQREPEKPHGIRRFFRKGQGGEEE